MKTDMSKIAREVLNQREYLAIELEEGEYLDEDCLAAVGSGQEGGGKSGIEGILPISYTQFEGRILRYDINTCVPFTEYKKQIRDAEMLCRVFLSILDTYKQAESYLLDPAYFLLKQDYIYVDKETGKAWMVLCPVYRRDGRAAEERGDFPDLFHNMIRGIRLPDEDMAFYGNLSYELDREENFHIVSFRRFLTEKGRRADVRKTDTQKTDIRKEQKSSIPVKPADVPLPVPESGKTVPVREDEPVLPFPVSGPSADSGKKKGSGLLGGLFGGKTGKNAKPKNSDKTDSDTGKKRKGTGGIMLPDAEELPKGFLAESKANTPEAEENPKKNKKKKDKAEKAVKVFEPVMQTDDEPFAIPPTDDDCPEDMPAVRRLYLKQADTGEIVPVVNFPFIIGREGSGLTIEASRTKVSRQHAIIKETEEGYTIRDVSRHGTFLDGERIAGHEDVPLRDGMHVMLKEVAYIVDIEERKG